MHTRTTTITLLLLAATLTACTTTADPAPDKPAATSAPALNHTDLVQQCTDAVAQLPVGEDGTVPSDPIPAECVDLSDSDYLDAYMDGINQANQDALNAR